MRNQTKTKLGLGTVQFGLDYGVSNEKGQTPEYVVEKILIRAAEAGIQIIDTAHAYGNSEQILGSLIREEAGFNIVSKTPRLAEDEPPGYIIKACKQSLHNLNCSHLYGLLVHNYEDIAGANSLRFYDELREIKYEGLAEKVGVSLYGAGQIDNMLQNFIPDIVQLPMNILDQRLITSGHLKKLKDKGVEVHVRSAFLQGALLMGAESLPPFLIGLQPNVKKFEEFCVKNKLSKLGVCLAFLMQMDEVDNVICGVNTLQQFNELLDCVENLPKILPNELTGFAVDDEALVNPALWNK